MCDINKLIATICVNCGGTSTKAGRKKVNALIATITLITSTLNSNFKFILTEITVSDTED